jgi:hypothetical protein
MAHDKHIDTSPRQSRALESFPFKLVFGMPVEL